jgi:hypothetical protein
VRLAGDTTLGRTASLSKADFEAVVNSSFEVRSASGDRSFLVLANVEGLNPDETVSEANFAVRPPRRRAPAPRTEAFALTFFGTGPELLQNTYALTHQSLGTFDLFIVPSVNSYVAVFNRLLGPASKL